MIRGLLGAAAAARAPDPPPARLPARHHPPATAARPSAARRHAPTRRRRRSEFSAPAFASDAPSTSSAPSAAGVGGHKHAYDHGGKHGHKRRRMS